jgi:hypothetical protein
MRTTLTIDDDILGVAKHLAQRDRTSVGKVISALVRQGLACEPAAVPTVRNGVQLLPRRRGSALATPELVNQLRDESPWRCSCLGNQVWCGRNADFTERGVRGHNTDVVADWDDAAPRRSMRLASWCARASFPTGTRGGRAAALG